MKCPYCGGEDCLCAYVPQTAEEGLTRYQKFLLAGCVAGISIAAMYPLVHNFKWSTFEKAKNTVPAITAMPMCSVGQYLGADGTCRQPASSEMPYAVHVMMSPQTVLSAVHGQGVNPMVECFSAGHRVICGVTVDGEGNVTVYWSWAPVDYIAIFPGSK